MVNESDASQERPQKLFGRRKGRPLRTGRRALMEGLLPKIALQIPPSGRLDPQALFDKLPSGLWLEIGFGGGEHLAAQAAANPTVGLIGCEPFINGVASLLGHVEAQKLDNVRIWPDDARTVLDALPESSLERCFVLFADPWPKKRHWERRFIGPENLPRLARALKAGGELRLATDVPALADWMREKTEEHPAFEKLVDSATPPADWVPTRYEQKGREAGRLPVYLIYKVNKE